MIVPLNSPCTAEALIRQLQLVPGSSLVCVAATHDNTGELFLLGSDEILLSD